MVPRELRIPPSLLARVAVWLAILVLSMAWQTACSFVNYDLSRSSTSCLVFKGLPGVCHDLATGCIAPAAVSGFAPRWFGTATAAAGPVWAWVPLAVLLFAPGALVVWPRRAAGELQEALFKAVCVPLAVAAVSWCIWIHAFRYTVVFTGACECRRRVRCLRPFRQRRLLAWPRVQGTRPGTCSSTSCSWCRSGRCA